MAEIRVDVAYALVRSEQGEVLVVRNRDGWSLPGGRREEGETLAAAAVRETWEEAGLRVRTGGVVSVSERTAGGVHEVFVVFAAERLGAGEPAVSGQDADVVEVRWTDEVKAAELMPWYPSGPAGWGGTAEYFVS